MNTCLLNTGYLFNRGRFTKTGFTVYKHTQMSFDENDRRSKFILIGKYFSIIVISVGDVSIYLHFLILKALLAFCDPYTFVLTSSIAKKSLFFF